MKIASFILMLLTAGAVGVVINNIVPEQPLGALLAFVAGALIGALWPL